MNWAWRWSSVIFITCVLHASPISLVCQVIVCYSAFQNAVSASITRERRGLPGARLRPSRRSGNKLLLLYFLKLLYLRTQDAKRAITWVLHCREWINERKYMRTRWEHLKWTGIFVCDLKLDKGLISVGTCFVLTFRFALAPRRIWATACEQTRFIRSIDWLYVGCRYPGAATIPRAPLAGTSGGRFGSVALNNKESSW